MSAPVLFPGRGLTGAIALAIIAALLALDLSTTPAPDPFTAPPPLALGSGQAPTGAHCSGS